LGDESSSEASKDNQALKTRAKRSRKKGGRGRRSLPSNLETVGMGTAVVESADLGQTVCSWRGDELKPIGEEWSERLEQMCKSCQFCRFWSWSIPESSDSSHEEGLSKVPVTRCS